MINYHFLDEVGSNVLYDLGQLLAQETGQADLTDEDVLSVMRRGRMLVAIDADSERIVAMATLAPMPLLSGNYGFIGDIIVLAEIEPMEKRMIERQLVERLVVSAKASKLDWVVAIPTTSEHVFKEMRFARFGLAYRLAVLLP